jgi:branched-chain amino acid aminotransferase
LALSLSKDGTLCVMIKLFKIVNLGCFFEGLLNMQISNQALTALKTFHTPEQLGFGTVMTPIMVECDYRDGVWSEPKVVTYGPLYLDPTTKVLHYGQEIFEGMKAYRVNGFGPYLFRPDKNFKRFNHSARRMAMPEVPEELFMESVKTITKLSAHLIPNKTGESLYIRPFMIGTQVHLGIKASTHLKFLVVASPSSSYFSSEKLDLLIEREAARACPGGTGTAKTGGNYAASLKSMLDAQALGYHQVLWLDSVHKKYVEELSGMNIFFLYENEIHTPSLTDTILEGVTRDSILKIASNLKLKGVERKIDINEVIEEMKKGKCLGAFACGTASIIAPINSFGEKNGERYYFDSSFHQKILEIKKHLLDIQEGRIVGPEGWQVKL